MKPRTERWFLVGLVFFSLLIRVVFLLQVSDNPFFNNPTSDAYYYDAQARSIATGDIVGSDAFFRAPGYPYFLGGLYALLGRDLLIVRGIQHALGVVALLLLYFLSRRIFDRRVAIVAALMALLYPVNLYFEGQLLFDWFLTFLVLGWLVLYYAFGLLRPAWHWFLLGLLFGILCITRPTFLPLSLPLVAAILWNLRRVAPARSVLVTGAIVVTGIALAILPVTIRNYSVSGDPVLIASQGGINFYIGNNSAADGFTARIPTNAGASWEIAEMSHYVETQIGHRPTPSEESDYWYAEGFRFIRENPVQWGALILKKTYLFFNAIEIPNNLNFYTFSRYSSVLQSLPAGFWCVGPLGLLGMAFAWRAKRGRLAIGFVVLYSSVMILFFVCDRYRLPVIPLLIMFAAYAAVRIYDMMRQKKLREAIPALAGLLLLAGFVNSNAYHLEKEEPVHQYYMLGLLAQQNGKHEDAVENFRHAAALGKPIRNLYLHWGTNEAALGRIENAKANFHKELQYHPDSYGALANLAETCLHERSLDSAMELSRRAIEIKPYEPSAYVTLGQSHYIRHDLPRADSVLAVGMERCGNRFRYGTYLLAGIRLERHDLVGAEKAYHSVLGAGEKVPAGYEPTFLMPTALTERVDAQILHGKALYGLGHVFAARRQIDSAAHYFELAIRKMPSLADAWADLGVARLQLHELALADTALRHALLLQPDNPLYLYNHGMILGASGKLDEARAAFERALALRPGFSPAENALALLRRLRTK